MQNGEFLGDVPVYPRSKYVRELRAELPANTFELARSRLALIPIYVAVIVMATITIAKGWLPWAVTPLLSVAIGVCFGCLTFVAHETLHGGTVRGKLLQQVAGFIGFLPFVVSPRLWVAWHNRDHHANTNLSTDPDAYPTLDRYHARRSTRFSADMFSLGGRRLRGGLSLILGFSVQSMDQLITARTRLLAPREHRLALAETALGVLVWATVAALVGFVPFLFVFVLPLLIGNACVMAFILTNHSLSPRTTINDPLLGGLSVTTSRLVERVTLGFGFHVEHHLFPTMSTRHAPAVRALIKAHWPERYQSMRLVDALRRLHCTARVYKNATTLVDPLTGAEFSTLLPGEPTAATSAPEPILLVRPIAA
ncbi:MAG: Fatty acid desaturase [Myxococcales bacterium]|nr:Fatty acid desaturase [Myxococcales bacterium]